MMKYKTLNRQKTVSKASWEAMPSVGIMVNGEWMSPGMLCYDY